MFLWIWLGCGLLASIIIFVDTIIKGFDVTVGNLPYIVLFTLLGSLMLVILIAFYVDEKFNIRDKWSAFLKKPIIRGRKD